MLKQAAIFVRDLLVYDEQLIKLGRQNETRELMTTGYIVVDILVQPMKIHTQNKYNGTTEIMTTGVSFGGRVTVDFYGDGAYNRAIDFILLCSSFKASELMRSMKIGITRPSGPTDVKALTGQQYGERQQVEFDVIFEETRQDSVLRIDTAQLDIRSN